MLLLICGAETVHDSGVGDCSEILIFGRQYGTVTLKEKSRKKKWEEQWRYSLGIAASAIGGLVLRFSGCYQPAEAGGYDNFSVSVPGELSCAC